MRYVTAAGSLLLLLAAGCSSSTGGTPTGRLPATPTPRAAFLAAVRPVWPSSNTDRDLLTGGRADCRALAQGLSVGFLIDDLASNTGAGRRAVQVTVHAAARYLCPQRIGS